MMEPPNPTDVDGTLARVKENDAELTDINLNNIKVCVLHLRAFVAVV